MRNLLASIGAKKVPLKALLVLALVAQTALLTMSIYANRQSWLYGDNTFYETPAWNLASGHGFTINRQQWEDPYLTELYHAAHPAEANSSDIPAIVFPPGYGYFLAGVYSLAGRSQLAAVCVNGVLVLFTVILMFVLARRAFGESLAAAIALVLIAFFPTWAFWASKIMSDTLHLTLVTLFAVIWFVERPSVRRTLLAGLVLALACLTRPYTALLPLALAAGWPVFRLPAFSVHKVALLALITWGLFGLWTARNYYYFHKPIVVTSMGLGYGLLVSTYQYADSKTGDLDHEIALRLEEVGIYDFHVRENNARLQQLAVERIKQHPGDFALSCLQRGIGLWFSLGTGRSLAARLLLTLYFGLLFLTMVAGIVLLRRTRSVVLAGCVIVVLYYWMVFTPLNGEGRYLLAARPFALLISAAALTALLRRVPLMKEESPAAIETSVSYS